MLAKKMVQGKEVDIFFVQNKQDEIFELSPNDVLMITSEDGTKDGLAVFKTTTDTYYAIHTEAATKKLAERLGVPFHE